MTAAESAAMELNEQQIIREAWDRGHFWNPELAHAGAINQNDLQYLRLTDRPVIEALRSYSQADPYRYARHVFDKHRRAPWFDGVAGPAMLAMMADKGVCPVPDFAPPAGTSFTFADPDLQAVCEKMQANAAAPLLGSGQWKSCHGVGQFHCGRAMWDLSGIPAFLEPHFTTVLSKVREACARLGLLWIFVDREGRDLLGDDFHSGHVNTNCSFVGSSNGWIGLAILGGRETCSSQAIWARFLATYRGGQTAAEIINQWWTLIMHELLHNLGLNHLRGGIMSPSIMNGLQMTLIGDTAEPWCRQQFGGVPVPIPGDNGGGGGSPDPPTGDESVQRQLDRLRLENLVQQAQIDYLFDLQKAA